MNRTRTNAAATLLATALLLGGCGELTSGGFGEAEAWFTADEQEGTQVSPAGSAPGASPRRLAGEGSGPAPGEAGSSVIGGTLRVEAQAFLRSDASGQWVEITDGPTALVMDLRGTTEHMAGQTRLSTGSYTRFRVVFHRVEADVTAGLVIGGVPFVGDVTVELGADGTLTVEREVDVEVEAEASAAVLVDMNADVWLETAQLGTGLGSATVLEAALDAAVRVRLR